MILLTVEGTYIDGKVELAETPSGVDRARVLVTFLKPTNTLYQTTVPNTAMTGEKLQQALRERVLARMEKGYHLGGSPYQSREELYDRFN